MGCYEVRQFFITKCDMRLLQFATGIIALQVQQLDYSGYDNFEFPFQFNDILTVV